MVVAVDPFRSNDFSSLDGFDVRSFSRGLTAGIFQQHDSSFTPATSIDSNASSDFSNSRSSEAPANGTVAQKLGINAQVPTVNRAALEQNVHSSGGIEQNKRDISALQHENDQGRANFDADMQGAHHMAVNEAVHVFMENGLDVQANLPRPSAPDTQKVVGVAALNEPIFSVIAILDEIRRVSKQMPSDQLAGIQAQIQQNLSSSSPSSSGVGVSAANGMVQNVQAPAGLSQNYSFDNLTPQEVWNLVEGNIDSQPEMDRFASNDKVLAEALDYNINAELGLSELTNVNVQAAVSTGDVGRKVELDEQAPVGHIPLTLSEDIQIRQGSLLDLRGVDIGDAQVELASKYKQTFEPQTPAAFMAAQAQFKNSLGMGA